MIGPAHRRGERGQVAGVEVLVFGLLVFIGGTLIVANVWGVVDAKLATDSAAREATRWIVERAGAERTGEQLRAGARLVAESTLADHGRTGPATVDVVPPGGEVSRCDRISVTVGVTVPAIRLPFMDGFGDAFDVTATHSELVDPTRSHLAGEAVCVR